MQDLTLVGLSEDRKKLVLVGVSGEEYALPVDADLRAALRGDHAPPGQLEKKMDSALRPRDIQARIRAGESPDSVADAAQTSVDRIMNYASPVLAERAHIAERALRASLRRRAGEGPARVLGDAVAAQLRSENTDPDSVDWDAWRREDGRWTLVGDVPGDEDRRATFVFDVQGRYVVAEDDEARRLVGEHPARTADPQPSPAAGTARRLSPVPGQEELALGEDAIDLVTDDEQVAGPEENTVDLTKAARQLRGGTTVRTDELHPAGDADWMATQASDRPRPAPRDEPAASQPGADHDAVPDVERGAHATTTTPDEGRDDHPTHNGSEDDTGAAKRETPEPEQSKPAAKKSGRKGRRASVPSWDEIMFGGGRSE